MRTVVKQFSSLLCVAGDMAADDPADGGMVAADD